MKAKWFFFCLMTFSVCQSYAQQKAIGPNATSRVAMQQNSGTFQKINLKLPGDQTFKEYMVKSDGDYFVLNGDILIPKNPPLENIAVRKNYFSDPNCKTCSVTRDDSHAWFDSKNYKWDKGMIPVDIDPSVYSTNSCNIVKDALDYMNANTPLIFYPRKGENDYVSIIVLNGTQGGSSPVGRQGGKQVLKLFTGNFDKFTLCHELMHAVGVYHEQCRKDRDNYISINFDNIIESQKYNFQIEDNGTPHGSYDYCSIMEYRSFISSMAIDNTKPIITCHTGNTPIACAACFGTQKGLTDDDKNGIALFYGQIGVSRFASNQPFPMGCKGNYLDKKTATEAIVKLNENAEIRKLTGGITFYGNDYSETTYVPGDAVNGDGFIIPGVYKNSRYCYSMKTGTATAQGPEIGNVYGNMGIANSTLGWPETSEAAYVGGTYQSFNRGYMYRTPDNKVLFVLKGPIYDRWVSVGGIKGELGWPADDEKTGLRNNGIFQRFSNGYIYGNPQFGAFVVMNNVFDTWARENSEKGPLGYPISDFIFESQGRTAGINQKVDVISGYQKFEHGIIKYNSHDNNGQPQIVMNNQMIGNSASIHTASNTNTQSQQPPPASAKLKPGDKNLLNPQPLPPKN